MGQRDEALQPAGQPGGVFQCGTWEATPLPQSEGPLDLRPFSYPRLLGRDTQVRGNGKGFSGQGHAYPGKKGC